MSIWFSKKEKNGKRSLYAVDIPFELVMVFIALLAAIIGPRYFLNPSQIIFDSFHIGIFLIISGFIIFLVSKLSLFYKGIWNSFGTRYMKKQFKFLYIAGYISMISGLLLIILLIT